LGGRGADGRRGPVDPSLGPPGSAHPQAALRESR
jgi:hypothetical protein